MSAVVELLAGLISRVIISTALAITVLKTRMDAMGLHAHLRI